MSIAIVSLMVKAQRDAVRASADAERVLAETIDRLHQAEAGSGLELCPPAIQTGSGAAPAPVTLFGAAFAAKAAERRAAALLDDALKKLTKELEDRKSSAEERQAEIDKAAAVLAQALESARKHKARIAESIARDRAALGEQGDTFYQGCAVGLGLGCLSLGGYTALALAMVCLGRQSSMGSPLGAVLLTLFVVPIAVSALMQIVFGLKHMMVEAELASRSKVADEVAERAVEKARKAHAALQPGLADELADAQAEVGRVEAAMRDLGLEAPDPEADSAA